MGKTIIFKVVSGFIWISLFVFPCFGKQSINNVASKAFLPAGYKPELRLAGDFSHDGSTKSSYRRRPTQNPSDDFSIRGEIDSSFDPEYPDPAPSNTLFIDSGVKPSFRERSKKKPSKKFSIDSEIGSSSKPHKTKMRPSNKFFMDSGMESSFEQYPTATPKDDFSIKKEAEASSVFRSPSTPR